MIGEETIAVVTSAIEELPDCQREVVTLRDVEGWTVADDVLAPLVDSLALVFTEESRFG